MQAVAWKVRNLILSNAADGCSSYMYDANISVKNSGGYMEKTAYRRVLFAMDLSIESTIMIRRVVGIASIFKAELHILHVLDETDDPSSIDNTKEVIGNIIQPLNVPFSGIMIGTGDVQENILKAVTTKSIDLIIIGSHGKMGVSPLLGGTATAVLSKSKCDVLTLSVLQYTEKN